MASTTITLLNENFYAVFTAPGDLNRAFTKKSGSQKNRKENAQYVVVFQ